MTHEIYFQENEDDMANPGRPIDYPLAQQVIESVRKTGALQSAVDAAGVSRDIFLRWAERDQALGLEYARAKRQGIDAMVEETLRISDANPERAPGGAIDSASVPR